jgi:tight adherence protein B
MVLSDQVIITSLGASTILCGSLFVTVALYQFLEWLGGSQRIRHVREQFGLTNNEKLRDRFFRQLTRSIPLRIDDRILDIVRGLDPRKRLRTQQFSAQLPDALDQIAQALGAGLSLPQAIERASQYMTEPVASELRKVHGHLSVSHSFEQSFEQMADQYDSPELRLVISGIAVQSKLGGNMKQMLQRSARYCRQSHSLARSLKAQTAQSRLSLRIILCVPFVLCGVLSILMPSFLSNLLFTSVGRTILVIALSLDVIGMLWARRIMKVDI